MIVELHASPAAPPKGPFFQGKGKTLLPGLIDAHCHIASVESLEQAAALGVTTEFDMFGDPKKVSRLRRELDRGGPSQRGRFPHCGNGGKRTRRAPE